MKGLLLALLLASAPAGAASLTGGSFELRRHAVGSGAAGSAQAGPDTLSFTGGVRAFASSSYPLTDGGTRKLYPYPGGPLPYWTAVDNRIVAAGIQVNVDRLSVAEDFDFITADPQTAPVRADPAAVTDANQRIPQTIDPQAAVVPQSVTEFNVINEDGGFLDSTLARSASISMPYVDADNDGIVDGTNPRVRAKTLALYALDETRRAWVKMPGSVVDTSARRVTATTPHFSVYALIGTADADVDGVYAFPVPWAPHSGNPLDGTLAGGITFTNLPSEGTISIYTLSGQLVRELVIPNGLFPPQLKWDVRTNGGQDVVSGAYLWRVKSGKNSKVGKLVVIR